MRPMPDRWLAVWGESFAAALRSIDEPDEERARAVVAEAEEAAWEGLRNYAARELVSEARSRVLQREEDQRRREQEARLTAETERDGMAELRSLVGRELAGKVKPWTAYRLYEVGERDAAVVIALDDTDPDLTRARIKSFNSDGSPVVGYGSQHPVVEALELHGHAFEADGSHAPTGVRMARVLRERFDGQLHAVDPTPEEALALVQRAAVG
jgi:hypothetical protein